MSEVIIDRQECFPICNPEGREVGVVELFNYSPLNDRAELGLEIEPEWRGKGLGTKAVMKMMKYAREEIAAAHYLRHNRGG